MYKSDSKTVPRLFRASSTESLFQIISKGFMISFRIKYIYFTVKLIVDLPSYNRDENNNVASLSAIFVVSSLYFGDYDYNVFLFMPIESRQL